MSDGTSSARLPWQGAFVALCALLAYTTTLRNGLVWDDFVLLDAVRAAGFPGLLKLEFMHPGNGYYRPLVLASLWLDDQLAGIAPPAFHMTNILLHAANSFLVWRLLGALFAPTAALWGSLLFAVHPVTAEPVAFVSGRTDLWVAFFTLLLALRWALLMRDETRRSPREWFLWFALFVLGGLAKETMFIFPAILFVWGLLLFPPPGCFAGWVRRDGWWLSASAAGIAALLAIRTGFAGVGFGRGLAGLGGPDPVAAVNQLAAIPAIVGTYLRLLVWPWPLSAYYTQAHLHFGAGTVAAAAAILACGALTARRRFQRAGAVGLVWLAGFLLPVSGLVRITGAVVAERFLYLPLVGLAVLFGNVVLMLGATGRRRQVAALGAGAVLAVLAALSLQRAAVWRDEITLFERTQRDAPSTIAKLALAGAYFKAGRAAEAHRLRGEVYFQIKLFPQAVEEFTLAAREGPADPAIMDQLGQALLGSGDAVGAESAFRAGLRLNPGHAPAAARRLP